MGELVGVDYDVSDPLVEVGEAFVLGLALVPAGIDLLEDHCELKVAEDHVPVHR